MLEFEFFVFVSGFFWVGELGLTLSFFFFGFGFPISFVCLPRKRGKV